MRREILVFLVLALLCSYALAGRTSKKAFSKSHKARSVRAAPPPPPVEVATPVESPDYYYGEINIYNVYPQLVPVQLDNYTLSAYSTSYLPQSSPLCCVFGSASYSSNATNYGYSLTCPIPAFYDAGISETYIADCSDLSYPLSNSVLVVAYDGVPTISSISYPTNLYALGGQNVTITLGNMPAGDFYTLSVRPAVGYSWTSYSPDSNTVVCTTSAVPIGHVEVYVAVTLNSSVVYSETHSLYFKSVRIQDYSPSSGCVVGYSNITLNLDAPIPEGVYFTLPTCHFTPDYYDISAIRVDEHQLTPLQYDSQTGTFYCLTPPWSYVETTATLTLVDPYEQSAISNPVTFDFITECLNNLDNNDFCAVGNVPVFINGDGLPDTYVYAYAYVYADMEMTQLLSSDTFYFLNSSTGYYLTNANQYQYDTTYVKVSTYNNVISSNFTVQTTNSCISAVSPKNVPLGGGTSVTLTFGTNLFVSTNSYGSYHCLFIDPENFHLPQPATILNPNQVSCVSPPVSEKGYGTVAFAVSFSYPYNELRTTSPVSINFT